MKKPNQKTIQLLVAVAVAAFGCMLIAAGMILPPTGEIHPTVLTAFGEALTFSGAVIGIDYSYKAKPRTA